MKLLTLFYYSEIASYLMITQHSNHHTLFFFRNPYHSKNILTDLVSRVSLQSHGTESSIVNMCHSMMYSSPQQYNCFASKSLNNILLSFTLPPFCMRGNSDILKLHGFYHMMAIYFYQQHQILLISLLLLILFLCTGYSNWSKSAHLNHVVYKGQASQ